MDINIILFWFLQQNRRTNKLIKNNKERTKLDSKGSDDGV
jgi:hypothetical protein